MVVTEAKNLDKLRGVTTGVGIDKSLFKIVRYSSQEDFILNGRTNANCGSTLVKDYFANADKYRDDRKVFIRAHAYYTVSGYQYTVFAISEAWGEIRNWLCNWKIYDTTVSTRNCYFTIAATINGVVYNFNESFPDRTVS